MDANEILDKAHKWLGRVESLVEGGEEFKLTVLLGSPREENVKQEYIKAQNILNKMPCEHELVNEEGADAYAENLRQEIEAHIKT